MNAGLPETHSSIFELFEYPFEVCDHALKEKTVFWHGFSIVTVNYLSVGMENRMVFIACYNKRWGNVRIEFLKSVHSDGAWTLKLDKE